MIRVLMTGAGAPGGPGIIKALKQDKDIDLWTADTDELASGRFLSNKFIKVPNAKSPDFINFILEFCLQNKIEVIFPLVTLELFRFAKEKDLFIKNGIKVIVSDWEYLDIANNKSKLMKYLNSKGIEVPEFRVVTNRVEIEKACFELGYPDKPVVIKPSVSNGSRGVRVLQKRIDEYDLLFNEKPGNLYSNLEKLLEILGERDFPELLISEYLPGEEYTIDTLVHDGKVRLIIPRSRIKMNGGISVKGVFIENTEIIEYCGQIINSMKLEGPIGIQVKGASDGKYKILEINPRIQGTSVAAIGAGVNLPLCVVKSQYGLIEFDNIKVKWGTGFARYYEEVFFDLNA